jgi:D-aminopeptidase
MSDTTHSTPSQPRARGLAIPFDGQCGAHNAITDVPGVEVGFTTIIEGSGALAVGQGPVRTGVTAIFPRGREAALEPAWAGLSSFNGNGELTGAHWINEAGYFNGPICLTNTHSVGMTHHALVKWLTRFPAYDNAVDRFLMPVVAETCDADLNDMNGLHVTEAHVRTALESARAGPLAEGNVGGGTGMICYEFKGGTGTASRRIEVGGETYHLGALVQANFGRRRWLTVRGVPVGKHLTEHTIREVDRGSIIAVVATDAPLLPIQLQRVARRISLGVGRTGTIGANSSGDIFLALSTGNPVEESSVSPLPAAGYIPSDGIDPVFEATVEAVEEAIINALIGAETMVGRDDTKVAAIDHARLQEVMRAHGRLNG